MHPPKTLTIVSFATENEFHITGDIAPNSAKFMQAAISAYSICQHNPETVPEKRGQFELIHHDLGRRVGFLGMSRDDFKRAIEQAKIVLEGEHDLKHA